MEALVNLLAQYLYRSSAVFAAINAQQASEDNSVVNGNVAIELATQLMTSQMSMLMAFM